MTLSSGQVVDQYRLDQTIHRGRATVVYAATDLGLGRQVAFKVLGERYATDPMVRDRFVKEAQVAASLDAHPHIVTVYKWGEFEGSMFFVTELIDGISLAELLERQPGGRPLPPAEALSLLAQVADALDFAHRRRAIHRDVKPANVMVRMTDTPRSAYLVDFGITKMDDGESGPQGLFLGTADYASPEQISGAQGLDRRSDVYSLACTAFETLTGRPPYGDAPNDAARLAAHLQSPIPSAHALRPELPEDIDRVFAKALAKNREDRFDSCGEFVRELRAVFPEGTHIFRRPPPPGAELPPPELLANEGPPRKWPWVLLAVFVLLLGTTLAYFLTGSMRNPEISVGTGPELTTTSSTTTTSTTTTSTTTTTTTSTTTTTAVPQPFGPVGPPVTEPSTPAETFAVGVQNRRIGSEIAAPISPAMLYAEWVRLLEGPEAVEGPVRQLEDDGLLVVADEPVAVRDVQVEGGQVVDFTECHADRSCLRISAMTVPTPACEPAAGCPTVDSQNGRVRAVQVATLNHRWPEPNVIYELRSEVPVTAIGEATRSVRFDGQSQYFLLHLDSAPDEDTPLILRITLADGTRDEIRMNFNAPEPAPPAAATTTVAG
jgi:serine/threonine protein kinase